MGTNGLVVIVRRPLLASGACLKPPVAPVGTHETCSHLVDGSAQISTRLMGPPCQYSVHFHISFVSEPLGD